MSFLEVAKPASTADKKSLPSLIFLSFGIFLLNSVNDVIRDRQRRLGAKRVVNQIGRNGRSYSDNALESLLQEHGEFMDFISSISLPSDTVSLFYMSVNRIIYKQGFSSN